MYSGEIKKGRARVEHEAYILFRGGTRSKQGGVYEQKGKARTWHFGSCVSPSFWHLLMRHACVVDLQFPRHLRLLAWATADIIGLRQLSTGDSAAKTGLPGIEALYSPY